jgi:predicted membrane-bound mannosyltransferase
MKIPWTRTNPLLGMWLSAANGVAGSARGRTTAAAKRQVATAQTNAARSIVDFWTAGVGMTKARRRSHRS